MHRLFALLAVLAAAATTVAGCGGDDSGSPDIAFVSSRDGEYAIFTMSADGKGEQRLTPREGEAPEGESVFWQIDPAWSPDATKIAFVSARTGEAHVYVMSADGTGRDSSRPARRATRIRRGLPTAARWRSRGAATST